MAPRRLGTVDRAVLGALLPGVLETGFEGFLTEFEAVAPSHLRRAFRLALVAAGWAAPILIGRPPPLSLLSSGDRTRALAAMESSRMPELRQLARVLKTVVGLHYGALPHVRQTIGYHS